MNHIRCLVVVFLFYIIAPIDILHAADRPSFPVVSHNDRSSRERPGRSDNVLPLLEEREVPPAALGHRQGVEKPVEKNKKKKKRKKNRRDRGQSGEPQSVVPIVDLDQMSRQRKTLSLVNGLDKNWDAEDLYLDKVSIRILQLQNLKLGSLSEQELSDIQSEVAIGWQNMTLKQDNFKEIVDFLKSSDVAERSARSTMRQYSELLRRADENRRQIEEIQSIVQERLSAVGRQERDIQQEPERGRGANNVANPGVDLYQKHLLPMVSSSGRSSRSGVSRAPLPVVAQGDDVGVQHLFPGPFSAGGAPLATTYSLVRKVQDLLFQHQGKLSHNDVRQLIRSEQSCKLCSLRTGKVCKNCQGLKSGKNNFEDKMKQLNDKLDSEISGLNIFIKGGATDEQLLECKSLISRLYDAQKESVKILIKSLLDESFITILEAQQQASQRKLALIDAALACRGFSEGERVECLGGVESVDVTDLQRAFEEVKMFGYSSVDDIKDFENRVRKCRDNPDGGLQVMKKELNALVEHVKSVGNYELLAIKHARSDMVKVFRAEKKVFEQSIEFLNNEIKLVEKKRTAQSAGLGGGTVADPATLRLYVGALTDLARISGRDDVLERALRLSEESFEKATAGNCASCDKRDEQLRICGKCRGVGYCNSNCQGLHWADHKKSCSKRKYENDSYKMIKCLKEFQRDESDENRQKLIEALRTSGCFDVSIFSQRLLAFITAASVQEDLQKKEWDAAALQKKVSEKEHREEQERRKKEEQKLARKFAQQKRRQKELALREKSLSLRAMEQSRVSEDRAKQEEPEDKEWRLLKHKLRVDALSLTIDERKYVRDNIALLNGDETRIFNIYYPTVHGKPQKARPAATPAPASKPGGGNNNGKQKGRAGRGNQNHGSNQQENARALAVRQALSSGVEKKPRDFPPLVPTSAYEKRVWRGESEDQANQAALDVAKRSAQATAAEGKEPEGDLPSYPMVSFGLSSDEADAQNLCDVLSGLGDLSSSSSSLVPFSSQGGRTWRGGSAGVLDATEQSFFATMASGKKQDANAAMPASDESLVFPPFFEDELGGIPYDLEKMVSRHFLSNLPEGSTLIREFPNGCTEYDVPGEGLTTFWPPPFTVGDAKKVAEEAYRSASAQVSLEGDCCVVKGIGNRNVVGSDLRRTDIPVRLVHNWRRGRWATFFPDMRMPLFNPVLRQ